MAWSVFVDLVEFGLGSSVKWAVGVSSKWAITFGLIIVWLIKYNEHVFREI